MKIKVKSKKKTILLILLAVLLVLGTYIGIDQIIFNSKKDEIISSAKQYSTALVTADSIKKEDYSQGNEWIVKNQKQKMDQLLEKYSFRQQSTEMILIYTKKLETDLNSGWKWYDKTIDDVQVVSAKKYPFDGNAYVTLTYHTSISCDKGGAVIYDGEVSEHGLDEKANHKIETYYKVEYALKYESGWKVSLKSNSTSNQKNFLENSSSH